MSQAMFNACRLIQRKISQNVRNSNLARMSTVAYQFKKARVAYYPDRQAEMKRINVQLRSELVAEKQEKKSLPKDFYYKLLGVTRSATTQQIKSAYYTLAKRFHPDAKHTTAAETKRFQEISSAYHILTDDSKRLEYDQMGVVRDEQSFVRQASQINKMTPVSKGALGSVQATREELLQANDAEPKLELTFIEAAHGLKKKLDLRFLKKCPSCNGKSPKQVTRANQGLCRKCDGTGQVTKRTRTYSSLVTCDQCQGKRYTNRNTCETCQNRGIVMEEVKVQVPVRPGVKTGDTILVENPVTSQRVNYRVIVKESGYYRRVGRDIHTDRYLTISEAVLGGIFKVRGIYDDIEIKVEPGTESHSKVVVKGKGLHTPEGVGDHVIIFKVRIPRQLSMKQRQLILALSKTEDAQFQYPVA